MQLEFARLAEEMSELASEAKLHSHTHHQQQQQQQQPEQHQSASKKHRQRGTRNKNKVSANKLDAVKASPTPYSEDTPYQDEAALLNDQSLALLKELQDCFELLALRAKHVSNSLSLSFCVCVCVVYSILVNTRPLNCCIYTSALNLTVYILLLHYDPTRPDLGGCGRIGARSVLVPRSDCVPHRGSEGGPAEAVQSLHQSSW